MRGYYICSKYDICTYYISGRTDNVIYITYQAELIMSYITCQVELILSHITCKVHMISGNERLRFSPPLMKYIILPDTRTFDRYIRHFLFL